MWCQERGHQPHFRDEGPERQEGWGDGLKVTPLVTGVLPLQQHWLSGLVIMLVQGRLISEGAQTAVFRACLWIAIHLWAASVQGGGSEIISHHNYLPALLLRGSSFQYLIPLPVHSSCFRLRIKQTHWRTHVLFFTLLALSDKVQICLPDVFF